jgi:hypothetical protein
VVDEVEVRVRGGGFTVVGVAGLAEGFVAEFASGASWNNFVFP